MAQFFKICRWIVEAGLYLAPVSLVAVMQSTVFPYLLGRVSVFQIIIEILVPFYLYLCLMDTSYRPRRSLIFCALSAYLAVIFVSAVFGVDFLRSFWGYRDRMDGIFTMLHFFVFFLMLAGTFRNRREWFWFFNFVLVGGLIIAADNLSLVLKAIISAGKFVLPREGGMLGNAMLYGSFVLLEIFVALFLFLEAGKKWLKVIYGLAAGFFVFAVLINLSRSSILALAVGATLSFIWFIWRRYGKRAVTIFIVISAAVGISFGLFVYFAKDQSFVINSPSLARVLNFSPSIGTAATRIMAWQAAWKGFIDRPFLGWGYVNFYAPFDKFYNPVLLRQTVYETWFDRAHNVFFEYLATAGILGIGALIFLAVAVAYPLFAKKNGDDSRELLKKQVLAIGIITYFIQDLFSIDHFNAFLILFAFFAYLGWSPHGAGEARKSAAKTTVALVAGAAIFSFLIPQNIRVVTQARREISAVKASSADGEIVDALDLYKQAILIKTPYASEVKIEFIKSVVGAIQRSAFNDQELPVVLAAVREQADGALIKRSGRSAQNMFQLGRLYSELGKLDPASFDKAELFFDAALKLSPARQQTYFGYGREKLFRGDIVAARSLFEKMIVLDPESPDSHWYVGTEYNKLGIPEALDEILTAINLGFSPRADGDAWLMIEALKAKKLYSKIPAVYQYLISAHPEDAGLNAELAALYKILGENDKARAAALRAMELDPNFVQEGRIFIKSLEK